MKIIQGFQAALLSVAVTMMLSSCGSDSDDTVIITPPASSGKIYTKDETLTILLKSIEYLSVFDVEAFVDPLKSGTDEPLAFNCDTTTTPADIFYTDEGFIIVLGPITDCTLNGVVLNTESRVTITYKTAAQALPALVYSIDDTTNISALHDNINGDYIGYFDGEKIDPSSQTLVQSMAMGTIAGGVNTMSTGTIQQIDWDENGVDTPLYQYLFTNQIGNSYYFTDQISSDEYVYVLQ